MTSSTIGGGTTSSGTGCPLPRGAGTEDEEPRQSASHRALATLSRSGAEEMASWRPGRRGDGVLEGRSQRRGSVGSEAEVAERGEQGGGGERKAEGEAPIRSHGEKDTGRDNFVYLLLDTWQAEAA